MERGWGLGSYVDFGTNHFKLTILIVSNSFLDGKIKTDCSKHPSPLSNGEGFGVRFLR